MGFGDYPKEYNRKIHGPYDPARFYGQADVPFECVKIGEIGSWLGRRSKDPRNFMGAISRAWWRWQHKYMQPKRAGIAPLFQILCGSMTIAYIFNYGNIRHHKNHKYH